MLEKAYQQEPLRGIKKPHIESAINIPIFSQLLKDPYFKISKRAIDSQWIYDKALPLTSCGFNPATNRAYIGKTSQAAKWLKNPMQSIRPFNFKDYLLNELFYIIHDYFHCWSYTLINDLKPDLKFGYGPINKKNIEDYVFCHILTETVATVGLDYWYLSTIDLNEVLPVGTEESTLTVSYHVKNRNEYKKFNPSFNSESVSFLKSILRFYCDGLFEQMPITSIKKSPMVYKWCWHEMSYGSTQRIYTRMWLSYLANEEVKYAPNELGKKIVFEKKWMKDLADNVAHALWEKVKKNKPLYFKPKYDTKKQAWGTIPNEIHDFRFMNIMHNNTHLLGPMVGGTHTQENFRYYLFQKVLQHKYSDQGLEASMLFPEIAKQQNISLLKILLKDNPKLPPSDSDFEPAALFLLP